MEPGFHQEMENQSGMDASTCGKSSYQKSDPSLQMGSENERDVTSATPAYCCFCFL
jgi:hypothetical protein